MDMPRLVDPLILGGHSGCLLAVVDSAALILGVPIALQDPAFHSSGPVPKRGTSGSDGHSILKHWGKCCPFGCTEVGTVFEYESYLNKSTFERKREPGHGCSWPPPPLTRPGAPLSRSLSRLLVLPVPSETSGEVPGPFWAVPRPVAPHLCPPLSLPLAAPWGTGHLGVLPRRPWQ